MTEENPTYAERISEKSRMLLERSQHTDHHGHFRPPQLELVPPPEPETPSTGDADGGARESTPVVDPIAQAEQAGDWGLAMRLKNRRLLESGGDLPPAA